MVLLKIWNAIKAVFKPQNITMILLVSAVILFFMLLQQCNRTKEVKAALKTEQLMNNQNLAALNEQIKVIKKINGDVETSKATYIGSVDELKKYNAALAAKFQSQQNLLAGIYSDFTIKLDSIISIGDKSKQYNDSTYGITFNAMYDKDDILNNINGETKFNIIKGKPSPINTTIYSNEIKIGITYGFRELKDRYEVFAVSKSDKVKFNELEGVYTLKKPDIVPVKKLKWGVGPCVGVTYGMSQGKIMPYFGVGLSYNLIRF